MNYRLLKEIVDEGKGGKSEYQEKKDESETRIKKLFDC
jgi:hypothetical protein